MKTGHNEDIMGLHNYQVHNGPIKACFSAFRIDPDPLRRFSSVAFMQC